MDFDFEAFAEAEWNLDAIGPKIADAARLRRIEESLLQNGAPANFYDKKVIAWISSKHARSEFKSRLRKLNGNVLADFWRAAEPFLYEARKTAATRQAWAKNQGGGPLARVRSKLLWRDTPDAARVSQISKQVGISVNQAFDQSVREGRILTFVQTASTWEFRLPSTWATRRISSRGFVDMRLIFCADLAPKLQRYPGQGSKGVETADQDEQAKAYLKRLFDEDYEKGERRTKTRYRALVLKAYWKVSERSFDSIWEEIAPNWAKLPGPGKTIDKTKY